MKKDRHYYREELDKDWNLLKDKEWMYEALKCILVEHQNWKVSEGNLNLIIDDKKYTIYDYLDFLALENKIIAQDLRKLEGLE